MTKERYPRLEIDLAHLRHNVSYVVARCAACGIQVAGVIKGVNGLIPVARQFAEGGASFIASSRLEQLADCIEAGIDKPMMLIRIPMLSEAADAVRYADISLQSDLTVLREMERQAALQGRTHQVILMADLGDLREGWWDRAEMKAAAVAVEREMPHLRLAGTGTNLGCYGSIVPTADKLAELVDLTEDIEAALGRRLAYISGGATSSLIRVWKGDMPSRINHLRIGEGILLARDLGVFHHCDVSEMYQDTFRIQAEVIEVRDKPSHPVGEIGVDAFGHTPVYVDRGIRRRALLALGKVDYGDPAELLPLEAGIEVLGASSDHTIVDVQDAARTYRVGDVMTFGVNYATLIHLTNSRNVQIAYI